MSNAGWCSRPFTDCVETVKAPIKIKRKRFEEEGAFPVVSQEAEFINGRWSDPEDVLSVPEPVVVFGDHTTVLKYIDFDFVVGADGVKVLKPTDLLLPKYLYYYLLANPVKELGYARHFRLLKQLEIRFPTSLAEQRRIVGVLDEAFAGIATAIANTRRNLANARELFDTCLETALMDSGAWAKRRLEEVVADDCSLSYGIVQPGDERDDGLPVVRPVDLNREIIGLNGLKRIDPSRAASYARTTLMGGELLLCVRGTTGTIAIASDELAGANVTRGIVPIRFDPDVLTQDFGYFVFRSPTVQSQIKAATYGAALMQINIRDLRKLRIVAPPLETQHRTVTLLHAVSRQTLRLVNVAEQKLAALEELKQSTLHRAFRGELAEDGRATEREVAEITA